MDTWAFTHPYNELKKSFIIWQLKGFGIFPDIQEVEDITFADLEDLKMVYDIYNFYKSKNDPDNDS